jgi:predicted short-subunit dehydrogenase-like oxidoreductase (DUF2520 family)
MEAIGSVAIIGTGNVASHLGTALFNEGIRISGVYGRKSNEAYTLSHYWNSEIITDLSDLHADLALICVSDDAVNEIVSFLPSGMNVAYTSGSVRLDSFSMKNPIGVFYPLQTFTKGKEVDIFEVPFLIEASLENFAQELFDLASKISRKVVFANSEERTFYHIAAVWVNNFTNHLSYQAKVLLDNQKLDFDLLLPLLRETVDKLHHIGPLNAQTGPARRGDQRTIEKHEKHLAGLQKELYMLITRSIIETYRNDKL